MNKKNAFILLIMCYFSCNQKGSSQKMDLNKNKLIDNPGVYLSTEYNIKLSISIRSNLLVYSITDTMDKSLVCNIDKIPNVSNFQRWFFVIDSHGDIWLNSSDVGLFVLKQNNCELKLMKFSYNEKDSISLPKIVYSNLPSSIKGKVQPKLFD